MKLYNNTPDQVFYTIAGAGSADCGTIDAGQTTDLSWYDDKENVNVSFTAVSATPVQTPPFTVTIPSSGTGMAVTIGLYQE
jgi:hypothetical protein